jgi:hypothetical protein
VTGAAVTATSLVAAATKRMKTMTVFAWFEELLCRRGYCLVNKLDRYNWFERWYWGELDAKSDAEVQPMASVYPDETVWRQGTPWLVVDVIQGDAVKLEQPGQGS